MMLVTGDQKHCLHELTRHFNPLRVKMAASMQLSPKEKVVS